MRISAFAGYMHQNVIGAGVLSKYRSWKQTCLASIGPFTTLIPLQEMPEINQKRIGVVPKVRAVFIANY